MSIRKDKKFMELLEEYALCVYDYAKGLISLIQAQNKAKQQLDYIDEYVRLQSSKKEKVNEP